MDSQLVSRGKGRFWVGCIDCHPPQAQGRILLVLGLWLISCAKEPGTDAVIPPQGQIKVTAEGAGSGVRIEEVEAGSALERAGVESGDLFLSWERLANPPSNPEPAAGTLESTFDWLWLEVEQAPRGTVRLVGRRDGEEQRFEVAPGPWHGKVSPRMNGAWLETYLEGKKRLASEDLEGAMSQWAKVAESETVRSWMLLRMGETWAEARAWEKAHALFVSALEPADEPQARVAVWRAVGEAHRIQGELDKATEAYRAAQKLAAKAWGKESLSVAVSLNSLGRVAWMRGDLGRAADFLTEALEIRQKLAPKSLSVASSLNNLGVVAMDRADMDRAADYYTQAVEIQRKLAPNSPSLALGFNNLGILSRIRGDPDQAAEYHNQALKIRQRLAPKSLDVANSLNNLGTVAMGRGDLDQAADALAQALEIKRELAPKSLDVANSLGNLGIVATERGDLDQAADYLTQALEIQQKLAPNSTVEAMTLHRLGRLASERNQLQVATSFFQRALQSLEGQVASLGGSQDSLARFRAYYSGYYRDQMGAQLKLGRSAAAFETLERSRAQSFLAGLTERSLGLEADLSEDLRQQRRRAQVGHDQILDKLAELSSQSETAERRELEKALERSLFRLEEIRSRVRFESPRLAAVLYPEPLGVEATQELLEPGELLLSYFIDEDQSLVFAIGPQGELFAVFELATERAVLEKQIRLFRVALQEARSREFLRSRGRPLWEALLEPVRDHLREARRVIVVPDGPLHFLPFALLQDSSKEEPKYLVESHSIAVVASATALSELRKARRVRSEPLLVAFGDPHYPAKLSKQKLQLQVRMATERGLALDRLPYSRNEVEGLREIFPRRSQIFVGRDATEERAKSLGQAVTIVHFATHGLIDEDLPWESSLALAIPEPWQEGNENGLLQVWEIYEHVRLDADLVTLSACDTALGKELAGEGILGLTRAFQFAGARSVLASLWKVSDESTAQLMERFYRHLLSGLARDQALRAAQLEMLSGAEGSATHPYLWAGFQLYGDWR